MQLLLIQTLIFLVVIPQTTLALCKLIISLKISFSLLQNIMDKTQICLLIIIHLWRVQHPPTIQAMRITRLYKILIPIQITNPSYSTMDPPNQLPHILSLLGHLMEYSFFPAQNTSKQIESHAGSSSKNQVLMEEQQP